MVTMQAGGGGSLKMARIQVPASCVQGGLTNLGHLGVVLGAPE